MLPKPATPQPRRTSRFRARAAVFFVAGLICTAFAPSARAQVAGALSLQNDYEFRGYSLTARKPAAVLNLSYDHASGLYLNGSAIGDLDVHERPQLAGLIANAGYARRISPRISLDAGISHLDLYQRYGVRNRLQYSEAYVGVLAHDFSSHLYYSPAYFRHGVSTLYGEIDWGRTAWVNWRLYAHAGVLGYVAQPTGQSRVTQVDWRVGVSHPLGPLDGSLAITGGGPSPDFYDLHPHQRTTATAGLSWTF